MSDSELELEYGQMYQEFSKYLKDDKFFKAFAEDYGPKWHDDEDIFKKHYNIVYHLYVRRDYSNSGGIEVSGNGYNALEMMVAILFNNEPRAQDDILIFSSQYLEGRRMKNKCCNLMCQECLGDFYKYFPSREDVDNRTFVPGESEFGKSETTLYSIRETKKKDKGNKKKNKKRNDNEEEYGLFELFPYKKIMMFIITMFFLYMLVKYMFCG